MSKISAPIGAVVRVWFPVSEEVMKPGPKLRPCLILAEELRNHRKMVLVSYGTSQNTAARGAGELTFKSGSYSILQKETKFNLKRSIWLPLEDEYFDVGHNMHIRC